MKTWWIQTPTWQRYMLIGLAMAVFVTLLYVWVWNPLQVSIANAHHEIAEVTKKTQVSLKDIAALRDTEQDVAILREKWDPLVQQVPTDTDPTLVRREVVNVAKRAGVVVRLWKPQHSSVNMNPEGSVGLPDIIVKVEGSFQNTTEFLHELLELSWIHTINPLVIERQHSTGLTTIVATDLTIRASVNTGLELIAQQTQST